MRQRLHVFLSSLARHLGVYRPLRAVYHKLFYAKARQSVTCGKYSCTFATPTPTVVEHVTAFTGEQAVMEHLLSHVRADDIVWDVGAAYGLYTVFMAQAVTGQHGRVCAFEPEQAMQTLLRRNLGLNNCTNVQLFPFALGASNTETVLYQSDSPNVGTSALVRRTDYKLKKIGIPVPLRTGDSLVHDATVPSPCIIKLDVEGAETEFLRGAHNILRSPILRLLYCEVHPSLLPLYNSNLQDVETLLTTAGLTIIQRQPRGTELHLIASRQG